MSKLWLSWSGIHPAAATLVWSVPAWAAQIMKALLHFTKTESREPIISALVSLMDNILLVSVNGVCVCVRMCVSARSSLLPRHPLQPLHLCVNVVSPRSYDCQSPPGPRSAKHWSLHISCSIPRKASSTDAAAELISSESMTKSLWKHFYLCVCLCGELRGPLAGLPLRLSWATDVQGRLNQFDLQEAAVAGNKR